MVYRSLAVSKEVLRYKDVGEGVGFVWSCIVLKLLCGGGVAW